MPTAEKSLLLKKAFILKDRVRVFLIKILICQNKGMGADLIVLAVVRHLQGVVLSKVNIALVNGPTLAEQRRLESKTTNCCSTDVSVLMWSHWL